MPNEYEPPRLTVLGEVTEYTQGGRSARSTAKPGIFFDLQGSTQGSNAVPQPGTPGTS